MLANNQSFSGARRSTTSSSRARPSVVCHVCYGQWSRPLVVMLVLQLWHRSSVRLRTLPAPRRLMTVGAAVVRLVHVHSHKLCPPGYNRSCAAVASAGTVAVDTAVTCSHALRDSRRPVMVLAALVPRWFTRPYANPQRGACKGTRESVPSALRRENLRALPPRISTAAIRPSRALLLESYHEFHRQFFGFASHHTSCGARE